MRRARPEFFGGGGEVVAARRDERQAGAGDARRRRSRAFPKATVHHGQPVAVSLTQITELGAAYTPAEVAALGEDRARHGRGAVHMDGARFANAVAGAERRRRPT